MQYLRRGLTAAAIVLVSAAAASAAADPALTCQSGKLGTAGKYGACRLKAESKAVKAGDTPDYSKCDSKYATSWQKSEDKAGPGICPTEGDETGVGTRVTYHTSAISTLLSGGIPFDPYSPATGQTTSYGTGDDGDVEAGATLAYVDNADGTITDLNTGLMWEKKVMGTGGLTACVDETGTCANPHNADNAYDWSDGPCCAETDYDGTIVTIFLEQLNNRCDDDTTDPCTMDSDCTTGECGFAGHRDWRLPSSKELYGITDLEVFLPSMNAAFRGPSCGLACTDITDPDCSCDAAAYYWSATTIAYGPTNAWSVYTDVGYVDFNNKTFELFVRAVRGGS